MRPIKFKAKCKLLNKWMYGSLVKKKTGKVYINSTEVHPETVCEFSGLQDIHLNDIYEYDITNTIWSKEDPNKRLVLFINGTFYGRLVRSGYGDMLGNCNNHVEVIGNKFDNPELLEGKNLE